MIQQSMHNFLIKQINANFIAIKEEKSLKNIKFKIKEMKIFKIGMIIGLGILHHT